ncbi:hypothetical protein C8F04DRAFT_1192567 [Mycena alexandri]|uniref:Zn(2)-C6 fungal-type domain-containing protein n=1 Tax=Mycena alexandri TaxID=1745969 RepID=A0AAD6SB63_9AGAR|nr:hypothetical protein C8F04DRAFT_1192567 [Mycena alexandri]
MSFESTQSLLSIHGKNRPSLEVSHFSTKFQQWDLGSEEPSPTSHSPFDTDYSSSSSPARRSSQDLDNLDNSPGPPSPGLPPARQRTIQACGQCRQRKTRCSGDHPVCKRCTARGLICQYSDRERVRRPAKARVRTAMSSSSLDLRFADNLHASQGVKQEDESDSARYSMDYPTEPQSQYQQLAWPTQSQFPFSQSFSQPGSPAVDPLPHPEISPLQVTHPNQFYLLPVRPFLQQHYVRRVQSQSALGAPEGYRRPQTFGPRPTSLDSPALSRFGPSVVEFDLRMPNGQIHSYMDDRSSSSSESRSTGSVFSLENTPHSFEPPLSRSASALDLRLLNKVSQYRHQSLSGLQIGVGNTGYTNAAPRLGLHSRAGSLGSLDDLSSPLSAPGPIPVRQINGKFGNPWGEDQRVKVREVALMCPSPLTPISLGADGVFYGYGLRGSNIGSNN